MERTIEQLEEEYSRKNDARHKDTQTVLKLAQPLGLRLAIASHEHANHLPGSMLSPEVDQRWVRACMGIIEKAQVAEREASGREMGTELLLSRVEAVSKGVPQESVDALRDSKTALDLICITIEDEVKLTDTKLVNTGNALEEVRAAIRDFSGIDVLDAAFHEMARHRTRDSPEKERKTATNHQDLVALQAHLQELVGSREVLLRVRAELVAQIDAKGQARDVDHVLEILPPLTHDLVRHFPGSPQHALEQHAESFLASLQRQPQRPRTYETSETQRVDAFRFL